MNIEKYNKLHNELMNRLEAGEITTEQAKEVNDLAYDKYITESAELIGLIAGVSAGVGILSIAALLQRISESKEFKKIKEPEMLADKFDKCVGAVIGKLKKATISYKPEAISVMKNNIELFNIKSKELHAIDKKLYAITDPAKYNYYKDEIEESYDKLFKDLKERCEKNNKALDSDSEYVTDKEIIPTLKKYLKYTPYNRMNTLTGENRDSKWIAWCCGVVLFSLMGGITATAISDIIDIKEHENMKDILTKNMEKYPLTVCDGSGYKEVLKYIKIKFD